MKSFIINALLLLTVCACGNKSTSGPPNIVEESSSVSLKTLNKKVGSVLPVEDATKSDFEIKEAKATGIFESDYITEKLTSSKFYTKKEQVHPAGEWCNEEGTLIHLHIDEERLITRLHHIEVTTKEFYKNWLKQL